MRIMRSRQPALPASPHPLASADYLTHTVVKAKLKERKINITGGNKIDDCRALVKDLFDTRERDYPNYGEYYEKIVRVSVVEK